MAKTKINYLCPLTEKRRIGVLDTKTQRVRTGFCRSASLEALQAFDSDIGFFETQHKGKIIQERGEYIGWL